MNVIETGNVYENKPEDLDPEDVQDIPGVRMDLGNIFSDI